MDFILGIRERNTYIGIYRGEDTCRGRRAELKTYIGGGRGVRVGSDWVCGQIRKVVYSWVWIRGIGDKFRSLRGVGGVVEGRAMAMGDSSRCGSFGCWVVAWPRSLHLPYRRHIGSFDRIGVGCVSMLTTGGGVSMSLGTCAGSAHVQGIVGTGVVGVDSVVSLAVDGGVSRDLRWLCPQGVVRGGWGGGRGVVVRLVGLLLGGVVVLVSAHRF